MKWTLEAEEEIKKVPFFVRKKVKKRVEKEALAENKNIVTISEVKLTQKRFLNNMSKEVKGYQIDSCFGSGGCPNKIIDSDNLIKKLGIMLDKEDLLDFLQKSVKGDLKFHHEFRVTISECPNACSQPQIKDIGIIGAFEPYVSDNECTMCQMCIRTCKEDAITLNDEGPEIDFNRCLLCGQCAVDCETETIKKKREGFRVLLGGKLGRHPRLAEELPGIFTEDEVIEIVKKSVCFYKENSTGGKRFAVLLMDRNISEVLN